MDRPRSPVEDAGRWVRSIPPLGCCAGWQNTKSGAASPQLGETAPLADAYSIVGGDPTEPPRLPPRALLATGLSYRWFTDC